MIVCTPPPLFVGTVTNTGVHFIQIDSNPRFCAKHQYAPIIATSDANYYYERTNAHLDNSAPVEKDPIADSIFYKMHGIVQ